MHDNVTRRELRRYRGREINTIGDGFVATFDGPARAVQCAESIIREARTLDIDVRAGLHTGECEVRGRDLAGVTMHIGARVAAHAGPGEVLASRTVRDLVIGSGIEFESRGEHVLKGIPQPTELYAVSHRRLKTKLLTKYNCGILGIVVGDRSLITCAHDRAHDHVRPGAGVR
jgi:class 3 adenylate cyclase